MGQSEDRFTAAAAECLEVVRQTEATLDLFGRIIALEHLVKHAIWSLTVQRVDEQGGDNKDAIREAQRFRENVTRQLRTSSPPVIDPVRSDYMAAIVRDHADRVLTELVHEMEERLCGDSSEDIPPLAEALKPGAAARVIADGVGE
jgi:hypothetical protein